MLEPSARRRPPRTVPLPVLAAAAALIVVAAVALRRIGLGPAPAGRGAGDRSGVADTVAHRDDTAAGPTAPAATTTYTVAPGDTLSLVAGRFGTSVEAIMALNGLVDPDALAAGQVLTVQAPLQGEGPATRSLPDAELVNGPAYAGFDVARFVAERGGALAGWREEVNGEPWTGPEIVARVVDEFSVGPRALLAIVEARTGVVSGPGRTPDAADYPAGLADPARRGLWLQLNWLADRLNGGFYDASSRGAPVLTFSDGVRLAGHPSLNAGSFAVQRVLALQSTPTALPADVAAVLVAYAGLFGPAPAADAVDAAGASRPAEGFPTLTLPFARGETWWLTGGPHGGWGDGSAWAAIDFVPDEAPTGCGPSAAWVTAAAAGVVVPGGTGQVVLDLDADVPADGDRRTGPVLFHLHLAAEGRVAPGTRVAVGDRLGHPSCEGGFSNATHVHLARLRDGAWLSAAGDEPLVLGGWTAFGSPRVYDGGLRRDGATREACECRAVGGNDVRW